MRKHFFVKKIIHYMVILIVLLSTMLVVYSASSLSVLREELQQEASNLLQLCGNELRSRVERMDGVLHEILLQQQSDLQLLKSSDESKRFYALQRIKNYIRNTIKSDTGVNCIVVADVAYDLCIDAEVASIGYWDREALREYAIKLAQETDVMARWHFITLNDRTYIAKAYAYKGRTVAAFTIVQDFLSIMPQLENEGQALVLTDGAGVIKATLGDMPPGEWFGRALDDLRANQEWTVSYPVVEEQVLLHNRMQSTIAWNQTRVGMIASLTVAFVTLLFGAILIRYLRQEMLHPIRVMVDVMTRIDNGEHSLRQKEEFGTVEFSQLRNTFNNMMDEILSLKIQSYEKLIALQDMELKSIRLQIHPHFFLNAISTISSLSMQGKNVEIQTYVETLSKNIRYMFKFGLHTVSLSEEIHHIENYFAMQECKYPGCIFYFIDMPKELEQWLIPQMLIQTFIENEYKYAVSMDTALTIFIRASQETRNGEEMLLIRIEDDGKGYPEDVLCYMNGEATKPANDGSRMGLWNIKRMLALMYERNDLVELSNIQPHGCMNHIWIPAKPKHELNEVADTLNLSSAGDKGDAICES